jgi:hypothetical protein
MVGEIRKVMQESAFSRIYVDKDGGFSVTDEESYAGVEGRGHPTLCVLTASKEGKDIRQVPRASGRRPES